MYEHVFMYTCVFINECVYVCVCLYVYVWLGRETLLRVYAVDCLRECGKVLMIGNSISSWPIPVDDYVSTTTASTTTTGTTTTTTAGTTAADRSYSQALHQRVVTTDSTDPHLSPTSTVVIPWNKWALCYDKMVIEEFRAVVTALTPSSTKVC